MAIIGRTGKYLAENSGFGQKMYYFELNDIKLEEEKIKKILEFIKDYKKIIVFHGKYEKVLLQKPVISEISEEMPVEEDLINKGFLNKASINAERYIFEPSPEEILEFFEEEIVATLFNQTVLEHQLSRYASRVMAMHHATENAKKMKQKLLINENKIKRQSLNKKQIELFSNIYGYRNA